MSTAGRAGARWGLLAALAAGLLASPVLAADRPSLADLGLKGEALFKSFTYFANTPNDNQQVVNEGVLQLEWSHRLGAWGSTKIVGRARDDDVGFTRELTFQIPETSQRRSYLDLREATLSARGGPIDVTLGKQIFAWGTADAFNPTDNLNPYDYLDVLDNEKLGIWSAAARASHGATSLTFVAVPFFTPSRLPLFKSRWTPVVPPAFRAVADDPVRPEQDASATQYAARLKSTFAGVDASLSYYDGFRHTLAFRQSALAIAPGVTLPRLTPVYTREKVPGADVSTTLGRFEIHAEAAARFVESNGRDDVLQTIGGINYTQDVGWKWLDQVVVILEYARETSLRRVDSRIVRTEGTPVVGDLLSDRAFRNAPIGRIQAKLTEDTSVKLSGVADLTVTPSYYLQLKATHRITDALQAEAGLDFLTGRPETFWGRWGDNDRFFLVLRYLF
ncbi:MAG TPA: hypothetical protein VFL90_16235 [Methylomirabilota bacterium]|nr:hypothetical protein [Methylomirabilota bacterium]